MNEKLCVNCKYFKRKIFEGFSGMDSEELLCKRNNVVTRTSLITGYIYTEKPQSCVENRYPKDKDESGYCGINGVFYEPK